MFGVNEHSGFGFMAILCSIVFVAFKRLVCAFRVLLVRLVA